MYTSEHLEVGRVYTRQDLKEMFGIKDATINTGIFRPRGHDSIWLFVTEHKPADRIQYADKLIGNTLNWEGQTSGRKDKLIVEHELNGIELLLFYRKAKYEFTDAGFRYEGRFRYVSHSENSIPTRFELGRVL